MRFQSVLESERQREEHCHILVLKDGCCMSAPYEGGMLGYRIPCGNVVLPMYLKGPRSLWRWIDQIVFIHVEDHALHITDAQGLKIVLPELILSHHYTGPEFTLAEGILDKDGFSAAMTVAKDCLGTIKDGNLCFQKTRVGYVTYRHNGLREFVWPIKMPLLLDVLDGRMLFWRLEQLEARLGLLEFTRGSQWAGVVVELV